MQISKELFGKIEDKDLFLFRLQNDINQMVEITNYGGIITKILSMDKKGIVKDIVLGYDNLNGYLNDEAYFGSVIGLCASRIANAKFTLNGTTYKLEANSGKNHLHGGKKALNKVVWEASKIESKSRLGVSLSHMTKDGENGYPGNVKIKMIYSLNNDGELEIAYNATTDKDTIINLTNHSYFNLKGEGDILDHQFSIFSDKITETDDELVPTGHLLDVSNTLYDFRKPKAIKESVNKVLNVYNGYDNSFILHNKGQLSLASRVFEETTGRCLEVYTTEPSIHFYTQNFPNGSIIGKSNKKYLQHYGFCLETQHYPNSPNIPHFPSVVLKKGSIYESKTIYKFSTIKK